ncbi:CGNR zinc finger domain-containing protein [Nocardia caishijiensis]|uniref:RNA-binding Zn ribbon-like protein n=1 Tax=Nocardia caishijiensis TaxID=184756 RepID=A0ABQ6YSM2_9NOCA|nr:CGNR zinc finger domain-containing protein [Nocardia caishijiensis]KAF0848798.1 putative RNA-binding Zn ribbon-like protein [Nocardia caishijiensis]
MQDRKSLPPAVRRRFQTGRPCLDLAHTGGEDEFAVWEIVHTPADLGHWLGVILDIPEIATDPADLPTFRTLRAALDRTARGAAESNPPHPTDIDTINTIARTPPLIPHLTPDASLTYPAPTAQAALSTLARDAIDLFASPLATRIRVCASDNCALLFVDASRPGRRRWCSMDRCGNLTKVRKYRTTD